MVKTFDPHFDPLKKLPVVETYPIQFFRLAKSKGGDWARNPRITLKMVVKLIFVFEWEMPVDTLYEHVDERYFMESFLETLEDIGDHNMRLSELMMNKDVGMLQTRTFINNERGTSIASRASSDTQIKFWREAKPDSVLKYQRNPGL